MVHMIPGAKGAFKVSRCNSGREVNFGHGVNSGHPLLFKRRRRPAFSNLGMHGLQLLLNLHTKFESAGFLLR